MAVVVIGKQVVEKGWLAARSNEVNRSGVDLTTTHPPSHDQSPWIEAAVPGTVLATLLKNKLIPDPFYGLENESIIDIADSGRQYYTFWFFIEFECKLLANQHVDLNFRAINYWAEVYLNGNKEVVPKGMFRRHSIDITNRLNPNGKNMLAILVHPPDHPGRIPTQDGQGVRHEIRKDVAAQYVDGWDWMTPIRDRNTGIWDEVSLYVTGPVKIVDPHLVSTFFDHYNRVYLHTTMELVNRSNLVVECSLNFQVGTELEGNIFHVEHVHTKNLSIPAASRIQYTLPELFFYKPNLWWPNGMGKQSLYNVEITVDVKGYGESDSWHQHFGFRKIESHIDSVTGGRLFKVNGQPIFIRGGNWVSSDGLLRLSKKRYKTDIKFHADMNLNMIRCWGGGVAERPEFYHYCDIYGLMVWQEFWISGDYNEKGIPLPNQVGPLDHELFMVCVRDTVKLLRNHPSLALWVGGNNQPPPNDINTAIKNELKLHPYFESCNNEYKYSKDLKDPISEYLDGTRIYVQASTWDGFGNGKGDLAKGPYEIQNPEDFFKDDFYKYGFNPEVGSVGMPVADTVRATIPKQGWNIPLFKELSNGYVHEVPNPIWKYHKYIPHSKPGSVHSQILLYGTPKDLDDFCLKAHLVNYTQYRALLEGWSSHMWRKYTGVLIWKTQNPWTGFRGQLYDHLHEQTAGFYGCRCAAEPIHVQLNLATYFVEVVNTTSEELSDVGIEVSVWDPEGACPYEQVFDRLNIPSKQTLAISEMKYPKSENPKPVYFLLLKLYKTSDNKILSRNFYWLHLPGGDYKLLEQYKRNKVSLKISSLTSIRGSSYEIRMQIENTSKKPESTSALQNSNLLGKKPSLFYKILENISAKKSIDKGVTEINGSSAGVAFFLHFSVHAYKEDVRESEDTRILPVHYSDNYFSLVPGEVMTVSLKFEVPKGITPRVMLRGWNYQDGHTLL
ncbi:hypothetical protein ACP275_02G102300 [Erythranthe tilingii]